MTIDPYVKNLTCLYVEDDDFIKESFSFMLKRYFKELFIAQNGAIGLELFKEKNPDIIISDIRMPVMDGIEMVSKIKELDPNAYVIFITAFSDVEYLKAAIDLGVEGYITKPVDRKALIKKLNFLAKVIKNERSTQELLTILQILFDKQLDASVLYEGNEPKLMNRKFHEIFHESLSLEELISKFNIDINKERQVIHLEEGRSYEVRIVKVPQKYTIISFNDITDYEKEIFLDKLTGVYNRKYLDIIELKNKNICMILGDIDFFKKVNDTYGHIMGDKILANFANVLRKNLRKNDVIIRMGGEEFLVILNEVNDKELTKKIADSLREEIEKSEVEGVKITASFGVCCGKIINEEDFKKLYENADKALYEAKENGRNQVRVCKE